MVETREGAGKGGHQLEKERDRQEMVDPKPC